MNNHFKIWVKYLTFISFITALLSGCSTTEVRSRNSQETVTLTLIDNQKIAGYVVNLLLLNGYTVEETTFFFDRGKRDGRFGQVLESQLQNAGYQLTATDSGASRVTYVLDELAPMAYRVNIRVEPDYQMDLVYRLSKNDKLALHSVTVTNGSSVAVSCCNMFVEANNVVTNGDMTTDDITDDRHDSKVHEIEKTNTIDVASRGISDDSFDSLNDLSDGNTSDSYVDSVLDEGGNEENINSLALPSSSPNSSKMWAVQVMSLSENKPGVLEAISSRIEAMGYETYIAEVGNAKKVRVGSFESLEAAQPLLYEMRSNGYPDAFLWKPDI